MANTIEENQEKLIQNMKDLTYVEYSQAAPLIKAEKEIRSKHGNNVTITKSLLENECGYDEQAWRTASSPI